MSVETPGPRSPGAPSRLIALLAGTLALLLVGVSPAQEPPDATANQPVAAEGESTDPAPPADEPVDEPTDEPINEDQPVGDADDNADDNAGDGATTTPEPLDDTLDGAQQAAAGANPAGAPGADGSGRWGFGSVLMVLAALVVPVLVGNWFANQINMPDHAWKIATVLTTISVGALAVTDAAYNDGFKGGPDLAGGITLTYETDKGKADIVDPEKQDPNADAGDATTRRVEMPQLVAAIKQRVDPAGTKEVTIRSSGQDRIEVIVPRLSESDLAQVKKRITDLGQLEFRILADRRWDADRELIKAAELLGPSETLVSLRGEPAGRWTPIKPASADQFRDERGVFRQSGPQREALVKIDLYEVTGEYLINPRVGYQPSGPIVEFNFNAEGTNRFSRFTGANLPNRATPNVKRRLGILLDGQLISAPNLNSQIRSQGMIEGVGSEEEVKDLVSILDAGSLPAALNKTPLSEQVISPGIGADTVRQATYAITVSLAAVLVFMLLYYRFAGVVACLALVTNILLVLAVMVMMNAAFTLPGLAGLVLTVGMSVDANVLIFERIREELNRGAALRMAIRNGFERATTTIVDANLTTLITGVVLYTIGTDQIRGFAVTLVLGILMSMYTAIFASRVTFDIAERRRWIRDLKFSSIIGSTSLDFIGKRAPAAFVSLALIAVGLTAVAQRGAGLLNIDFTGGTSITMVVDEQQDLSISDVRATLEAVNDGEGYGGGDFTVVEIAAEPDAEEGAGGRFGRFTIDSSVEEIEEAEALLAEAFAGKLKTYTVDVGEPEKFTTGGGEEGVRAPLAFNQGDGFDESDGLTRDGLLQRIADVAEGLGKAGFKPTLKNPGYVEGSSLRFRDWTLSAVGASAEDVAAVAAGLEEQLESQPIFPVANKISGKVAGDLQLKAIFAIVLSLLGIIGYLWFRFQNVSFGLAAVVALVHDVLVTLGAIAISGWVVSGAPSVASAMQIDTFQISLPIVAAFLTIIGYSLNDTIVVFDRIREVRGKSPDLTGDMINTSINQTLARTLLTSLTTLLVVGILYLFGGAGIHAFAFALVVGVIVGTYSSIFVASPALLAMVGGKRGG